MSEAKVRSPSSLDENRIRWKVGVSEMSQPFDWYKKAFAADAWQGNFDSLEDLIKELDVLLERAKNDS